MNTLIGRILCVLIAAPAAFAAPQGNWEVAGDAALVQQEGDGVRLLSDQKVTAGIVSPATLLGEDRDAVVVHAEVAGAAARSVTFSVHDAQSGEAIGYWQNPLPITGPTPVTAVLTLSKTPEHVRLFAGTHGRPSRAVIRRIRWFSAHRTMRHTGSIYGAVIDARTTLAQTFRATGPRLAAAIVQIRRLSAEADGPDLRVAVYAWKGDVGRTVEGRALTETVVPRGLIPGQGGVSGTDDVFATYGESSIQLAVGLDAATTSGETYLLVLSPAGPCPPGQGFLLWGWADGYDDGALFTNNRASGWDLWLHIYEASH